MNDEILDAVVVETPDVEVVEDAEVLPELADALRAARMRFLGMTDGSDE